MRKTFLITAMFLYFVFCLLSTGTAFAEEKPVGKIISIIGMVEYQTATGSESLAKKNEGSVEPVSFTAWGKAKPHQLVYAKDNFRTSRKSRLKILFNDKSLIALGPKSKMKVASYIYKPGEKLRQGVINVAQGLAMYVINKSQKNKKSSFRIVTPTANIAARGTQGYISSGAQTLVANQEGAVEVSNSDLSVEGTALVEAMMKSIIPLGQSPTDPTPLTEAELAKIRNIIIAYVGSRYPELINDGTGGDGGGDGEGEGEGDFEEIFELFDDTFSESCSAS
ncbi:MAG: FecR family protein [Nitrospinales bacterium]